jgi:hypothetical protein
MTRTRWPADLSLIAKRLEGGEPRDGDGRGLLEAEIRRLEGKVVRWRAGVFGEGALAPSEHLVTGPESGHVLADRLHGPGDVHAQGGDLGLAQPEGWDNDADQVRQAGHDVPVAPMQASRLDLQQHLVVGSSWCRRKPSPQVAVAG